MRRMQQIVLFAAVLCLLPLTAATTSGAFAVRSATSEELSKMQAIAMELPRYPRFATPDATTLTNARVDDDTLLGAADAVAFANGTEIWRGNAVFGIYRDGSMYPWNMLPMPADCWDTRGIELFDYSAEALGIVQPGACSQGRPAKLSGLRLTKIKRSRIAANRAIAKVNRVWQRCFGTEFESRSNASKCVRRPVNRLYRRPVARLISILDSSSDGLAYAFCRDSVDLYWQDVKDHREQVNLVVKWVRRNRPDLMNDAFTELNKVGRKLKRHWTQVCDSC